MRENASLKPYHTFGIDVYARYLEEVDNPDELIALFRDERFTGLPKLILGGGSNVLFTRDFPGLVILNRIKGVEILEENEAGVKLRVASGEVWHELVMYCVEKGWGGIENLSLIPGTVGAAPMQNIGAYGVEIKEVLESVEYIDLKAGTLHVLNNEACRFAYRESIFKHELRDKVFITSVILKLRKRGHVLKMNYGDIKEILEQSRVNDPQIADISRAVIAIRQSKLPDPAVLGNAGSFFKNPEIDKAQFDVLAAKNPLIPNYPMPNGKIKIPAGWLIEQSGWKGKRVGETGSHAKQALVLVNYGHATGKEIRDLAFTIIDDVESKYGIRLNPEVNLV